MKYLIKVSCVNCKKETTSQSLKGHFDYCINKNNCKECNNIINKNKKFCNRSCSAKYNNKFKSQETINKQKETLLKTLEKQGKVRKPKEPKITTRKCSECGRIDTIIGKGSFRKETCYFCNDSLMYRNLCSFKFDLRKYPSKFDLDLLNKYGMFHPIKNKQGVSRDHKLSLHEGRKLKVSPEIMSHPANCELISQQENIRKFTKSSITLEELIKQIELWN